MTLKDQQYHDNVKLLRGYGVSISLKNNNLVLKYANYTPGRGNIPKINN